MNNKLVKVKSFAKIGKEGLCMTCEGIQNIRVTNITVRGFEYEIIGDELVKGYHPGFGQWYEESKIDNTMYENISSDELTHF